MAKRTATRKRRPLDRLAARLDTREAATVRPPAAQRRTIRAITARLARRPGAGSARSAVRRAAAAGPRSARALLTGSDAAAKSAALSALGRDAGLDVYRVDLRGVLSRYIGETEKHLARVFDAVAGQDAILVFDEAEALFGKRSEVKDAHDRYANIEVAFYLLGRVDAHEGLVVFVAGDREALTEALLRRLHFVIDFPWPSPC
jgi:SpoVK/Ycf46/Vps4 family AAA+-type ATPase